MTEQQWLAATDPQPMLEFLKGKACDRKLRLFAVACVRRIWHWLTDERARKAIEVAERFADGRLHPRRLLGIGEVRSAWEAAGASPWAFLGHPWQFAVEYSAWAATRSGAPDTQNAERAAQAVLLRDLFGNLFRPVALDPNWLTADVLSLAGAAYEKRTLPAGALEPERLSLLADALEEAGCDNADLLAHLRSEGPHLRGCWSVDLILGRE